jgi:hypothetical protein
MNARRARAAAFKAVAGIRGLQSRAAELAVARAENERRSRSDAQGRCAAALDETQRGWAETLGGASFDPGLARQWFADVGARQAEEKQASEKLDEAETLLGERRTACHEAIARAETADAQARKAASQEARRRDEARLSALQDQATYRRRRT